MFPTSMDEWVILEAFGRVPARRSGGVAPLRYEAALADYLEKSRAHHRAATHEFGRVGVLLHFQSSFLRACFAALKARRSGHADAAAPAAFPLQR